MGGARGLGREKTSQIESSPIPQDLSSYAFKAKLIDMLDFSKVDFNKAISLNPTNSQGEFNTQNPFENCKFDLVRLESLLIKLQSQSTKIPKNDFLKSGKYPIVSQEGDMLINGWTDLKNPINDLPLIIFGDHSCNFKFIDFPFFRGADGTQVLKFNNEIITKFAYFILQQVKITNAEKYERHFKYLKNIKIPLPPLEIQKQIVRECEKVEEQYNTIRMSIEKYQELIKAILVKCGIVDSNSLKSTNSNLAIMSETNNLNNTESSDLNNKDFIASLLDSIKELESKLDFDLLANYTDPTTYPTNSAPCHTEPLGEVSTNTESNPVILSEANNLNTQSSKDISPTAQYDKLINTANLKTLLASLPTPPKQGWERVKLSNVCRINEKTYNPSNEADKEYIYIDIDSVEKGTGKFSTDNKLLASNLPTRARRLADDDSVIISTVRPYLKGFAYIGESIKDSIFSTGFATLKGNERLKSKFIYILFMFSNDLMKQMEEKMPKASYPSINADDIKAFQIPLPPLEAQEKIISAIESVESQISLLDSSLSSLDSKKSEILQHFLQA